MSECITISTGKYMSIRKFGRDAVAPDAALVSEYQ